MVLPDIKNLDYLNFSLNDPNLNLTVEIQSDSSLILYLYYIYSWTTVSIWISSMGDQGKSYHTVQVPYTPFACVFFFSFSNLFTIKCQDVTAHKASHLNLVQIHKCWRWGNIAWSQKAGKHFINYSNLDSAQNCILGPVKVDLQLCVKGLWLSLLCFLLWASDAGREWRH